DRCDATQPYGGSLVHNGVAIAVRPSPGDAAPREPEVLAMGRLLLRVRPDALVVLHGGARVACYYPDRYCHTYDQRRPGAVMHTAGGDASSFADGQHAAAAAIAAAVVPPLAWP